MCFDLAQSGAEPARDFCTKNEGTGYGFSDVRGTTETQTTPAQPSASRRAAPHACKLIKHIQRYFSSRGVPRPVRLYLAPRVAPLAFSDLEKRVKRV